jgi:hypothetical protein
LKSWDGNRYLNFKENSWINASGQKRPMYCLFVSKVNTKKADLCAELLWGPSVWFLWEQECLPCLSGPRTGVPQCLGPENQTHNIIGWNLAAKLSHWSMPQTNQGHGTGSPPTTMPRFWKQNTHCVG